MVISKHESYKRDYAKHRDAYLRRALESHNESFDSPSKRIRKMLISAKCRAKKRDIPFNIADDDVKWNDICPVLNIPIRLARSKGAGGDDNSAALDRIENLLGYVKGNIRVISNRANIIKRDMTREEARLVYKNWNKI